MIYFFTPYSLELKLLEAIASYMALLQPDDWAVIMDGDTMFLTPNFGTLIENHIKASPDTGLFTSYASRCHYRIQVPAKVDMENESIRYHKIIGDFFADTRKGKTLEINRKIAGHLMAFRKSTWDRILPIVAVTAVDKQVLGVDTKISKAILSKGLKILLMEDIYLLHYCRLIEGFNNTKHLI
jgi:hypothetical protein